MSEAATSKRTVGRGIVVLLLLPVLPALLMGWMHPKRPTPAELSSSSDEGLRIEEIRLRYPGALWIDARAQSAFAAEHVPEALHLTEDSWETGFAALLEVWDGRRPLVVYCGTETCGASAAVARRLRSELGFDQVFVLRGGWDAWRADEKGRP